MILSLDDFWVKLMSEDSRRPNPFSKWITEYSSVETLSSESSSVLINIQITHHQKTLDITHEQYKGNSMQNPNYALDIPRKEKCSSAPSNSMGLSSKMDSVGFLKEILFLQRVIGKKSVLSSDKYDDESKQSYFAYHTQRGSINSR